MKVANLTNVIKELNSDENDCYEKQNIRADSNAVVHLAKYLNAEKLTNAI